jgi:excisionase family DNA binding protein
MATKNPASPGRRVSVNEVAEYYGVHRRTVLRWLDKGLIKATRVGPRSLRLDLDQVRQAVESERTA